MNTKDPKTARPTGRTLAALSLLAAAALAPCRASAQATFNQIQFVVTTADDNLRSDSSATATLFSPSGQLLQTVVIHKQNDPEWKNGQTNTATPGLTPPLAAAQIGRIVITMATHNNWPESDDSWNVRGVVVSLANNGTPGPQLLSVVGSPLASLTTSAPSMTLTPVPPAPAGAFNQMLFTITTGNDDLRGDSSVTAALQSPSGQTLETLVVHAQNDPSWNGGETHVVVAAMSPYLTPAQIGRVVLTLTTHNSSTESDDNWDVRSLSINLLNNGADETLFLTASGNPLATLGDAQRGLVLGAPLGAAGTFNQILFSIQTGADDLRGDSSASAKLTSPDGNVLQTIVLKSQNAPGWNNGTFQNVSATLTTPLRPCDIGHVWITLTSHDSSNETDDNWNIQSAAVSLSNNGVGGTTRLSMSGSPLARLTGSWPSTVMDGLDGCVQNALGAQPGTAPLRGFVDLHTHPMANLGFGGKFLYGGTDVGSLLPADPDCNKNVRATSMQQALGHDGSVHGAPSAQNPCGDMIRTAVVLVTEYANHAALNDLPSALQAGIDLSAIGLNSGALQAVLGGVVGAAGIAPVGGAAAAGGLGAAGAVLTPLQAATAVLAITGLPVPDGVDGAPDFNAWPVAADIAHQKMWVDWIRRSYLGGQRVLVALAVNDPTMAGMVAGPTDLPTDDKFSADLQIAELKAFVARHSDFMAVASTPQELESIVRSNKLAVVLGVEINNIGNLNQQKSLTVAQVNAEVDRLFAEGVRYIFPVHLVDNPFGGTAAYEGTFNYSNFSQSGNWWSLQCVDPSVTYRWDADPLIPAVGQIKLGINLGEQIPPTYPDCGQTNSRTLTTLGVAAMKRMMQHGMLIDIDHMSEVTQSSAIALAQSIKSGATQGYPLNSGHASLRGYLPTESGLVIQPSSTTERSPSQSIYAALGALHGMAGVGVGISTGSMNAWQWIDMYNQVVTAMQAGAGAPVVAGFGTDTDGLAAGMPPRAGSKVGHSDAAPRSSLGTKTWDYDKDGVAHYGLLPDFLQDAATDPKFGTLASLAPVNRRTRLPNASSAMLGADYFLKTWQKAAALSSSPQLSQ